ncbi:MAG: nucleoside triphosphate pyrophosphohydrolase [Bacteroidota bacterium]|nr:nucleoside triphosphate pyrophosphohydrolase [Bacteroidota bacterium]
MQKKAEAFLRLISIMDELREQCPWDKEQTIDSLRHLTLEEVYELSDAILSSNMDEIKKELGDILLHVVFYARIASESGDFNIADVIDNICDKLVHRHPHIYSDIKVKDVKEVKNNWEKLKLKEGKNSVLSGVPKSLPSLIKAYRIQEKVKGVGFEWENKDQVLSKVMEEFNELEIEIKNKNQDLVESEFGDLLFSLINYARFIGVNAEDALEKTNKKFIKRFQLMEEELKKDNKDFTNMSLSEMNNYWEISKKKYNL